MSALNVIAIPVPVVDADELDWSREQALAIISVMSVADECKSSAIPEEHRQTLYSMLGELLKPKR